ncbi:MAG: hypothetical protein OH318_00925 [Candidatus Parvarchaeota archaeon]|nr:hypothetical protein [Candidatus Rehaiarchaeum fermentans]
MAKSVLNTLRYARNNVPFYQGDSYKALDKVNKNNLESVLESLPIIDGSYFYEDNFYKFIPYNSDSNNPAHISIFNTSGSTGKPKFIPLTGYFIEEYAKTGVKAIFDNLGLFERPTYQIVIGAPRPAISGVEMSKITELSGGIEFSLGPGQRIIDLLKNIDSIHSSTKGRNSKVIIMAYPSILFREYYNLNEQERDYLKEFSNRYDLYISLGAETTDLNRAMLLFKFYGAKKIADYLAATETPAGIRVYDEDSFKNPERVRGFIMYDDHIDYHIAGKDYFIPLKPKYIGKEGELVITHKSDKNKPIAPLIKYNMHEGVRLIDFVNGRAVLMFLGRTNKVSQFGVSKLNSDIVDSVIAGAVLNYNLGEGYAEIVRDNGLDVLIFHLYKNNFNGTKEEVKSFIEESLSKKEMELQHTLANKLARVEVVLEDSKDKIPFYKERGKSTRLVDNRGLSHY